MTYTYKCQICRIHFDGPNEKPVCPRCGSKYTERLLQRGNKKIKKKKRFTGSFVEIGTRRCGTCLHSQILETTSAIKCTLPAPGVIFHGGKKVWICYSFQKIKWGKNNG